MDELKGAGWIKPIHPDERDAMTKAWTAAVAQGVPFEFEFRGRRNVPMVGIKRSAVARSGWAHSEMVRKRGGSA